MKKVTQILKETLENISPSEDELKTIEAGLEEFLNRITKRIRTLNISAEIFVGGSFAKGTLIKKDKYDIDIFIRFDKRYNKDKLSNLTKKILKGQRFTKIHGSRDYFRILASKNIVFEIIPVRKIKSPKEAENITDLSYSHVKYVKRKIKSEKILGDIRLAKAFCYGNDCYGAESYIKGFSGYALELLVYHYKGFLKFLRAMTRIKGQEIIDIEKHHKSKQQVLMDINAAKLDSPIVLIDPTYKQRNALAALSDETFRKFQKVCRNFLKNPTVKAFEIEKIDFEKVRKDARRKSYEFILLEARTQKQEGAVAGSKLLKFYNHLTNEIKKYFEIKNKGFEYFDGKFSNFFFSVKSKKEIILGGPFLTDKENVKKFRKKHKKTFEKKGRLYASKKIISSLRDFINSWKTKNRRCMKDMNIIKLKIKDY